MKEFSRRPREVTHVLVGRWVRTDGAVGGVGRTWKCCCGVGGVCGHTGLFTEAPSPRTGSVFPRFDITHICRVCTGNRQPHTRPHRPSAWLAVGRLSHECVLTGLFPQLALPYLKSLGLGGDWLGAGLDVPCHGCSGTHSRVSVTVAVRGPCLVRPHTVWAAGGAAGCFIPCTQPSCPVSAKPLEVTAVRKSQNCNVSQGFRSGLFVHDYCFFVSGMGSLGSRPCDK